jgi:transposase
MNETKKNTISASLKETKQRRQHQECKIFEVKIDKSHLNKTTLDSLRRIFLESKWMYNYILSQDDVFSIKPTDKISEVPVKVKDEYEIREIKTLGSQMKQSVIEQLQKNIINLSKAKKKGIKVGALNFINRCESIDLKQHGNTYRIQGDYIKVQNIKQRLKVHGLQQFIKDDCELANAKLIEKAGDFYFHITCYKEKSEPIKVKYNPIGIDFGIKSQLNLSNGIDIKYQIQPTKRLIKLCKDLSRKELHSANWYKARTKLQKEYEYCNNLKADIKNKILNILKTEFNPIIFQDDCMRGWQRIWGKRTLSTSIGGIIADLRKSATAIKVNRFYASTKTCSVCGNIQDVSLEEREYHCKSCGSELPRDYNSAVNIENEGLKQNKIVAERNEFKPVENDTSTLRLLERVNSIPNVKASVVRRSRKPTSFSCG